MSTWRANVMRMALRKVGISPPEDVLGGNTDRSRICLELIDESIGVAFERYEFETLNVSKKLQKKTVRGQVDGYVIPADLIRFVGLEYDCCCCCCSSNGDIGNLDGSHTGVESFRYTTNIHFAIKNNAFYIDIGCSNLCVSVDDCNLIYTSETTNLIPKTLTEAVTCKLASELAITLKNDIAIKTMYENYFEKYITKAIGLDEEEFREYEQDCIPPFWGTGRGRIC